MTDADAAALQRAVEAGIHRLPIPTGFRIGDVNAYLIEDEPLTLLDTGPNLATSLDGLEQSLAALGRRIEDLELIVISHQHMDHLGLVGILARRSGAEVAALDLLAPWVATFAQSMEADDAFAERAMARHGIPLDIRFSLRAVSAGFRIMGGAAIVTRTLADGSDLVLRDRSLAVHHRPGHSPSDIVLHDAGNRILLGADHLIKTISSNPLLTRPLGVAADEEEELGAPRPRSLVTYLDSLRATRDMDHVDIVLPGHGEPVTDHVALIDERFVLHERRAEKIFDLLTQRPLTAHEIAQDMWGNIAVTQAYLTLSEVLGHVDLLLETGRIVEDVRDDVVHFTVV